jgi:hypothetical protein
VTSDKAQLGLSHSYSRAKVKFNVNKSDNMIIQECQKIVLDLSISFVDSLRAGGFGSAFKMLIRTWQLRLQFDNSTIYS